ncbi:MAG TPA: PA2169 family four-helix-bundle protein, partial [Pyrinomonadaceae bacterium]|nr:PA2169 family four-helix-bundle protein [Pyrinomonadaceae bacterium]
MASNEEVVSTLNDLIEACRDGQEGFRSAAEGVRDEELRALFLEYSRQRGSFSSELQAEVRRLGGEPETEGSVVAAIHRGWMDIKAAVTGADDRSILRECERG